MPCCRVDGAEGREGSEGGRVMRGEVKGVEGSGRVVGGEGGGEKIGRVRRKTEGRRVHQDLICPRLLLCELAKVSVGHGR